MRVDIDSEYWVGVDEYNHTLYKHNPGGYEFKDKKSGDVKIKGATDEAIGYYPDMKQCIKKVIELKLSTSDDVVSLEEYLERLDILVGRFKRKIVE